MSGLIYSIYRYHLQLFVSIGSYMCIYASEYIGYIRTVINIQKPYAILAILYNKANIFRNFFIICIALEAKVEEYIDIITSLYRRHTRLVVNHIIVEVTLGKEQWIIIKKMTYYQVLYYTFLSLLSYIHYRL